MSTRNLKGTPLDWHQYLKILETTKELAHLIIDYIDSFKHQALTFLDGHNPRISPGFPMNFQVIFFIILKVTWVSIHFLRIFIKNRKIPEFI